MRKWLISFSFILCRLVFAIPLQEHSIDPMALRELATKLEIPSNADIVNETQKRWLRKVGQERWEMTELTPEQRNFVLSWAQDQGLFNAWKPLHKFYDKALILGATTSRMQMRLDYLRALWKVGVRFNQIIWLTGERPLDQRADQLMEGCQNESQAAHLIWEETTLPEEMRHLPVLFISVPMKFKGTTLQRPNTEDTILEWLKVAPEPCLALFVSDQPFCGYQFAIVKASLPETFQFDLVGPGVDPYSHPLAAAITLDSIARWLYQEHQTLSRLNEQKK